MLLIVSLTRGGFVCCDCCVIRIRI